MKLSGVIADRQPLTKSNFRGFIIIYFGTPRGGDWTFNPDLIRQPYASSSRSREGYAANASKVAEGEVELHESGKFPESWIYIPPVKGNSREYMNYNTQKPRALLRRIILGGSNKDDVVLDPFCGCGTTVYVARELDRQWLGIDISHFAIDVVVRKNGFPIDLSSAELLARESPFSFEKWAITRIPGMVPNEIQVADGGIDGRGTIYANDGLVLSQVKGGQKVPVDNVRAFGHVLAKQSAECGIFTTLRPLRSQSAKTALGNYGSFRLGASTYPRAQLWSIEEYFDDRLPRLPPLADPYNGTEIQDYGDLVAEAVLLADQTK